MNKFTLGAVSGVAAVLGVQAAISASHDATVAAIDTPALQEQLVTTGTFVVPPEHR